MPQAKMSFSEALGPDGFFPMLFLVPLVLAAYVATPVLLTLGWSKWATSPKQNDVLSWTSLVGFGLATGSVALVPFAIAHSWTSGGLEYYDQELLKFFGWGMLVSVAALVASIPGLWRKNVLRWYAPALAVCILLIWFASAVGE
jgi:hypothetical protein